MRAFSLIDEKSGLITRHSRDRDRSHTSLSSLDCLRPQRAEDETIRISCSRLYAMIVKVGVLGLAHVESWTSDLVAF